MRKVKALVAVAGLLAVLTGCLPVLGIQGARHEIHPGGSSLSAKQACLDNGHVCSLDGGDGTRRTGTPHNGAHRTTHGSKGYYWPELTPGQRVYIEYDGRRDWYTFYSESHPHESCVSCASVGDMVLQTSCAWECSSSHRILLHFGFAYSEVVTATAMRSPERE